MKRTLISRYVSPLRYPGGKAKIANFLQDVILLNNLENSTVYELYAGGAAASLSLLLANSCQQVVLNDLDKHIYAFWYAVLNETDELVSLIENTAVNIESWLAQSSIYKDADNHDLLTLGFATFFLNRSNRSGILHKAGPIGGQQQTGNYKIDVRFNKSELISRIRKIARFRDRIKLHNREAIELLGEVLPESDGNFIFLDPPYFDQGERLYLNFYKEADHKRLRDLLDKHRDANWILTYDNCEKINDLYKGFRRSDLIMSYTLQTKREAKEVVIFSDELCLPKQFRLGNKKRKFELI